MKIGTWVLYILLTNGDVRIVPDFPTFTSCHAHQALLNTTKIAGLPQVDQALCVEVEPVNGQGSAQYLRRRRVRFVVEGEWLGYTSSQDRIVHRTVHEGSDHKFRAWCEANPYITYTDGTRLRLTVRDVKPRERVQERDAYGKLIKDCFRANVTSVAALEP